jgi:hypothetical protein
MDDDYSLSWIENEETEKLAKESLHRTNDC